MDVYGNNTKRVNNTKWVYLPPWRDSKADILGPVVQSLIKLILG